MLKYACNPSRLITLMLLCYPRIRRIDGASSDFMGILRWVGEVRVRSFYGNYHEGQFDHGCALEILTRFWTNGRNKGVSCAPIVKFRIFGIALVTAGCRIWGTVCQIRVARGVGFSLKRLGCPPRVVLRPFRKLGALMGLLTILGCWIRSGLVGFSFCSGNEIGSGILDVNQRNCMILSVIYRKKQRAKALWLTEGDHNTSFFHAKANAHRVAKEVKRLNNEERVEVRDRKGIQEIVLNYFRSIFGSIHPTVDAMEEVLGSVERRVTDAMNEALILPFSSEDVVYALKQMHPLESPGPDDMSPIFFQKYWSIVGPGVCSFILDFLNKGAFHPLVNFTHIVFILKFPNPTDMTQFRPISLCNVVYKLASRCITNRIKPFLDSLISPSQSAFVPGLLITDNVLVAYELNHFLKNKNRGKVGYVSRSWTSVRLTTVWNGASLREFWSREESSIQGVAVSRAAPPISHLLFADDTLIFCKTSTRAMVHLKHILDVFEQASGLKINLHKSAMTVSSNVAAELAGILGVTVVAKHDKYLELSTRDGSLEEGVV
ncbi:UNVERIFIED_CONTAM: hypothetical protein Slati_3552600 [Sesamum latifolium]|uniref:Reverse transcriptase domain-containing protein n=1 Tax=Sesamum latifolium TaxID=2727402 RepID=A0AAW2UJK5_9LAMI